ncbi:MAG: ribose-phosphate pyrophosphokinase [Bacteroidales bacterium]|nr:ribose-phosphate pyrophosphokinase [Bacteroidales bacterium]
MQHEHRMMVFTCDASRAFAEKVVRRLKKLDIDDEDKVRLGNLEVKHFSDGEFQPYYHDSVRGATVFLIQSTIAPSDNLMELLLCIDAAKRASASKVIVVCPYFGWARQDRKDKPRTSIGAKVVANLLRAAGADRIMTCDLHADQIQGFFDIPVDHLMASNLFIQVIQELGLPNLSIASPDIGGSKRANFYANTIKKLSGEEPPIIICHKTRKVQNEVDTIRVIGDVEGRDVVIVDDIIDTAGTLCKAATELKRQGASSVRACATHALLSGSGVEKIEASDIDEVYVTDTVPQPAGKLDKSTKIHVVSMSELFAMMMRNVYMYEPISPVFHQDY